jgi:7,8-dihydropterin-6-yl-methyl-4-(beta-D-ribofuranosyl)aminobenzene 5'-phosphate synthase
MDMDISQIESKEFLNELSMELNNIMTDKYFTCHCTTEQAYNYLKQYVANLDEVKTGMVIEV